MGQVNVMDKESGVACYECTTQETQKVYPVGPEIALNEFSGIMNFLFIWY